MPTKFEAVEQRIIQALLSNESAKPEVVLHGTPEGFEVVLNQGRKRYKLKTQRKNIRRFKSFNTAISFLVKLGADRVVIDGLNCGKLE